MEQTQKQRERVVKEILDPVDIVREAPGPEGPWQWKSMQVVRKMNQIVVYDVDGTMATILEVSDLSNHPNPYGALKQKLNELNEETLNQL